MATLKTIARRLSLVIPDEVLDSAPEFFPIAPNSRLWLPKLGIGDDERFADIVRKTWKMIPTWARRMMVKYWRACPGGFIPAFWSPTIALDLDWHFSEHGFRHPKDLAACGCFGHRLFFYAPVVDAMPSQHVEELIAHELAHVVNHASGDVIQTDRTQPRWNDVAEEIADEIMQTWGFDPWAMDRWLKAHWKWSE